MSIEALRANNHQDQAGMGSETKQLIYGIREGDLDASQRTLLKQLATPRQDQKLGEDRVFNTEFNNKYGANLNLVDRERNELFGFNKNLNLDQSNKEIDSLLGGGGSGGGHGHGTPAKGWSGLDLDLSLGQIGAPDGISD